MPDLVALIDSVSDKALVVILVMMVAAMLEAALGLGVIIPGETVVVVGATVLAQAGWPWVILGILCAGIGASGGDHFGYFVGRKAGPPIGRSKAVASIGVDKWDRAMDAVKRQRIAPLVFVRQLPGVRTLVSAACGAARIRYQHFATASVIGALVWSILWVGGGALVGKAVLSVLGPALPILLAGWIVFVIGLFFYRRIKSKREKEPGSADAAGATGTAGSGSGSASA
ncbi:DedA family protein [Dietzia sp.]|uniref:DedA family protein n=1 Tax=Dietzia sp. TaxID=1871616 RepID=UPI002FDB63E6